jgi:hypothetical protein
MSAVSILTSLDISLLPAVTDKVETRISGNKYLIRSLRSCISSRNKKNLVQSLGVKTATVQVSSPVCPG